MKLEFQSSTSTIDCARSLVKQPHIEKYRSECTEGHIKCGCKQRRAASCIAENAQQFLFLSEKNFHYSSKWLHNSSCTQVREMSPSDDPIFTSTR